MKMSKNRRWIALVMLIIFVVMMACSCKRKYRVFSAGDRTITHISGTGKRIIAVVLDAEELHILDYKGNEYLSEQFNFNSNLKKMQVVDSTVLVVREGVQQDILEMYELDYNKRGDKCDIVLLEEKSLSVPDGEKNDPPAEIADIAILSGGYKEDAIPGIAVLTEDGKVWQTADGDGRTDFSLSLENVEYMEYVSFDSALYCITSDKQLLSRKDRVGSVWKKEADDPIPLSIKHKQIPVAYEEYGELYYHGDSSFSKSTYDYDGRKRFFLPEGGYSYFGVHGGVVYYNDKTVRFYLI